MVKQAVRVKHFMTGDISASIIVGKIMGASEVTANLYCNCVCVLGRLPDLEYIFAVMYGTLCIIDYISGYET